MVHSRDEKTETREVILWNVRTFLGDYVGVFVSPPPFHILMMGLGLLPGGEEVLAVVSGWGLAGRIPLCHRFGASQGSSQMSLSCQSAAPASEALHFPPCLLTSPTPPFP